MTSSRGGGVSPKQAIIPIGFVSVIVSQRSRNSVYVLGKDLQFFEHHQREDRTSFVYGFVRRDPLKVQPKFDPPTPRRVRWMPDRPLLVRISPMIERNLEFPPLGRSVVRARVKFCLWNFSGTSFRPSKSPMQRIALSNLRISRIAIDYCKQACVALRRPLPRRAIWMDWIPLADRGRGPLFVWTSG